MTAGSVLCGPHQDTCPGSCLCDVPSGDGPEDGRSGPHLPSCPSMSVFPDQGPAWPLWPSALTSSLETGPEMTDPRLLGPCRELPWRGLGKGQDWIRDWVVCRLVGYPAGGAEASSLRPLECWGSGLRACGWQSVPFPAGQSPAGGLSRVIVPWTNPPDSAQSLVPNP